MSSKIIQAGGKLLPVIIGIGAHQIGGHAEPGGPGPSSPHGGRPPRPAPPAGTGNSQIMARAESMSRERSTHAFSEGASNKGDHVVKAVMEVAKTFSIASEMSKEDFERISEGLQKKGKVVAGGVKVALDVESLSDTEKGELAVSAAKDIVAKIDLRDPFQTVAKICSAVKTLTVEADPAVIPAVAEAIKSRALHDAEVAGAGAVVVKSVASSLLLMPHPVAKGIGTALNVVNGLSVGSQVATTFDALGSAKDIEDSHTRDKVLEILEKKGEAELQEMRGKS